jgi:3-hydroxyacyl-CoA dehydrogenase
MSDTTITQIAVIGAGQMGAGITQTAASSGLNILLADYHRDAAENGKKKITGPIGRKGENNLLRGRFGPVAN